METPQDRFEEPIPPEPSAGLGQVFALDSGEVCAYANNTFNHGAQSEQTVEELTDFRTQALAQLAAQHEEIVQLRSAADGASRVTRLPSARTAAIGSCS
nr:hypothetical protein OG781_38605 [Streptomyces sp. NBC_00830]